MTTDSSAAPHSTQGSFDTGPLSWVMAEIRETLTRTKTTLREALEQEPEAQSTSLRHAKTHLHQAHGALQVVDVDGVGIITETVEDLLDSLESGKIALAPAVADAITAATDAVVEYLEELLAGEPHQPVRLFPYYQALLECRSAEGIHPADLFFPNLTIRPQFPPRQALPANYRELRQRYEQLLLPFLRHTEEAGERAYAKGMADIIEQVERAQDSHQLRAFWWVMHCFAEGVAAGQIGYEVYVKQLFARINLQIRALVAGKAAPSTRLLRDALFFIAQSRHPSPDMVQIRRTYQLDGLVPANYTERRYGQINLDALATAKEHLARAKSTWSRIAAGDASAIQEFEQEMQALAEAGAQLNSPPLASLLRNLNGIARHAARAGAEQSLGVELAASLLFIENGLSHPARLNDSFAEQSKALTNRLLALASGEQTGEAAPWLDQMSREAMQQQTMLSLVSEMQSILAQVEKTLDEYFGDPTRPAVLQPVENMLRQLVGALVILDQEQAVRAVQYIGQTVQRFVNENGGQPTNPPEFQRLARNVGALSFFIESLRQNPNRAKQQFSFNDQRGIFQANVVEKKNGDSSSQTVDVKPLSVKEQGAWNIPDSAPSALLKPVNPGNPTKNLFGLGESGMTDSPFAPNSKQTPEILQERRTETGAELPPADGMAAPDSETPLSLQPEHIDDGNLEVGESVDLSHLLVTESEDAQVHEMLQQWLPEAEFGTGAREAQADSGPDTPVGSSGSTAAGANAGQVREDVEQDAIDAELLEIFLLEATEVLECAHDTLRQLQQEPRSQEYMTTARRCFHTLKGSGRMVGLNDFSSAAWSIEQVLNLKLSEGKGSSPDLVALLEKAIELLGAWVDDLQAQGTSKCRPEALIAAADRVRKGEAFHYVEQGPSAASAPTASPAEAVPATVPAAPGMSASAPSVSPGIQDIFQAAELPMEDMAELGGFDSAPLGADVEEGAASSYLTASSMPQDQVSRPVVPETPFSMPATLEASSAESEMNESAPSARQPLSQPGGPQVLPVSNVIEFPDLAAAEPRHDDTIKRIGSLEIGVPLHNIYMTETDELVRVLAQDLAEWRHEPERPVTTVSVHAAHSLAGSSATVGFTPLHELAHALEMVLQTLARNPVPLLPGEHDTLEYSVECIKGMLQKFGLCEMPSPQPEQVRILQQLRQQMLERAAESSNAAAAAPAKGSRLAQSAAASELAPTDNKHAGQESLFEHGAPASANHAFALKDEIDADLLPVFVEEAHDMLPQMQQLVRSWQQNAADPESPKALLRLLHTVKGSARMAGAMALGQHMHDVETRIQQMTLEGVPSADDIEELLGQMDIGMQMFERVQRGEPALPAAALQAAVPSLGAKKIHAIQTLTPAADVTTVPAEPLASAATVPLVRVRSDVLDRLLNQAGEVSIARSKIETEVGSLRHSLSELTENVVRLRGHLREIEIQAESQMVSQMAQSTDRDFDPLEFDRFTRLQELTRIMAENVNDVASLQQNLSRSISGTIDDLSTQARLTRDLQQDLMRVRMVQFGNVSERLYRVTRQAAKDTGKRVHLDIRGGSVEIDRSVLEKMVGPFEHLLRNAIAHGIEPREARLAAGKNETGEVVVEVRQDGNEIVIRIADDGQGLNIGRIREKAQAVGLLTADGKLPDAELQDLIFHPGFSTATEVTELAGRGVGLDVVRAEATAVGGRVSVISEPGKGAQFVLRLPMSMAVTQVVLLNTGGKTYAVPSVLVEQVQQLRPNALAMVYNEGAVRWQGRRVPLYFLSALLGDASATPKAQEYSPVVILRSGDDRIAVHIDEVVGNREVVMKNLGPQLSRMIGIGGATVTGSGEIVLILDPVPLAQRASQGVMRAPRVQSANAPAPMGAVAEMLSASSRPTASQPVQGLRTQDIVMVVDDSLTVRRVTERLLVREGYQVVLAKDGVDALEKLQAITPDVMLLDIEMPRMDGFDLTRNIRGAVRTAQIPIIMITSRTAQKHRNYAKDLGVNEYLGKPYKEEELLELVKGFVDRKALAN